MTAPYVFDDLKWQASTLWNSTNTAREADAKAWWVAFRNKFRTALPGSTWKVGDLFRWLGATGKYGHGFVIRNTVLSYEWLIMGSAESNIASDAAYAQDIIQNAVWTTYFRRDGNNYSTNNSNFSGLSFMFNPDSSVSWNIGYNSNLELASGDWTAPTSNPYSALASFMTATKAPCAMWFNDFLFNYLADDQYFHIVIDADLNTLRLDALGASTTAGHTSATTKAIFLSGLSIPSFADGGLDDPGDTNRAIQILQVITQGNSTQGVSTLNARGIILQNRAMYMSAAGARVDGALAPLNTWTDANFSTIGPPPLPKARLVEVKSGATVKGYLDPLVALEAFPYKAGHYWSFRVYTSDPDKILVCEHESCCFMWPKDKGVYPYGKSTLRV